MQGLCVDKSIIPRCTNHLRNERKWGDIHSPGSFINHWPRLKTDTAVMRGKDQDEAGPGLFHTTPQLHARTYRICILLQGTVVLVLQRGTSLIARMCVKRLKSNLSVYWASYNTGTQSKHIYWLAGHLVSPWDPVLQSKTPTWRQQKAPSAWGVTLRSMLWSRQEWQGLVTFNLFSMTKIISTVQCTCNLVALQWLLRTWGPGLQPLAVSCLQSCFGVSRWQ